MKTDFPDGCQYCAAFPPQHENCLNGKKTISTNETVTCGCGVCNN